MTGDPVRPLRVGVHRKILLLLGDNMRYREDYEVPEVLSQKGIGRKLSLRQTHVSRALAELKEDDLVEVRTARIKGVGRKRKVYFLSDRGVSEMEDYITSLQKVRIPVRTADRSLRSIPVPRVLDLLNREKGGRPGYYHLLVESYDGSEVDLLANGGVSSSQGPPVPRHFFGREDEVKRLMEAVEDPSVPIAAVISLAGMGKTTLMGRVMLDMRGIPIDWTSITEWTGPERLLSKWARHLSSLGRTSLMDHLSGRGMSDPESALECFAADIRGLDTVLVLDDYHRAGGKVDELLSTFLDTIGRSSCTILIGSRESPAFYGREDLLVNRRVCEITLEGLDRESSLRILEGRGVPQQERERILQITGGHPLALELTARASLIDPSGLSTELQNYIGKELISGLEEVQKEVLFLAAAYEQPVVMDGLLLVEGSERSDLEALKDRLLLREYPDGTLDIHDLLRTNLRSWMGKKLLGRYTDTALEHLSGRGSERDIIHCMSLLDRAGKKDDMDRLVLDLGEVLLEWGSPVVKDHLRTMDGSFLSGLDRMRYLTLLADLDMAEGRIYRAIRELNEALSLSDGMLGDRDIKDELMDLVSRVYSLKAELSRSRGMDKEAISSHLENVKRMRQGGTPTALGKALNNLALAYKGAGQLKKAERSLNEALSLFEGSRDPVSGAFVEANLAELFIMRRDLRRAGMHLSKVDGINVRSGRVEARLRRKTGRSKMAMRDQKGALSDLERAYALSMKAGDRQGAALAVCDMIEASLDSGDPGSAVSHIKGLIPFLEGTPGEKWTADIAWSYLKAVHSLKVKEMDGDLIRGIDVAVRLLMGSMDPASFTRRIGSLREGGPEPGVLKRTLETAGDLFRERGEMHASIIVRLWLAEEMLASGDIRGARPVITLVRKDAKVLGFGKAVARADSLMKNDRLAEKKPNMAHPQNLVI